MANRHELSGAQRNSIGNQDPAQAKQKLAIVFHRLYGNAILDPIEVSSLDTGQEVFRDLKHKYLKLLRSESRTYWLRLLFVRMEVEIAEIRWVRPRDSAEWKTHKLTPAEQTISDMTEKGHSGIIVDLDRRRRHALLTEAIRNPCILANEPAFIANCESLLIGTGINLHNFAGQEVLVVCTAGDKEKIAWFLLLFLILSPVLGFIVGRISHQAEVGVAVSAGIFAMATFLQGLAAWLHS
ncbi:MAG: hypothetical protein Q9184_006273 [Pyrenodesmia sp. 2 TL-2023]